MGIGDWGLGIGDWGLGLHFKQNFSKENGEFWVGKRVHNQTVYDQIVEQWKRKYPVSYEHNKVKLLGYREIKKNKYE